MAALELLPYGVIACLKNKLNSSACRRLGENYGIIDKMEELISNIQYIETLLLDADDDQKENTIHDWIRKLKDAVQAADDFFDDIATHFSLLKSQDGLTWKVLRFFSCTNRIVFQLRIYHKLKKIQKEFDDIRNDLGRFKLKPRSSESAWRVTHPALELEIVGRDKVMMAISKILVEPHEKVSLIGIVGGGGIGKTTVAKKVFGSVKAKALFEVRVWVNVFDNFVVETIIRLIVKSLYSESNDEESFTEILNKLEIVLHQRRYLLVLDDMWNMSSEKWTQLMTHLMCGAPGSAILITTRSEIVAQVIGVKDLYHLQPLNPDESFSLLAKLLFHNDPFQISLESVGRQIVTKCRGVPLLIIMVAGMLRNKYQESEWIQVLEGDFWHGEDDIVRVLKLSYEHLSSELKQCFVHCLLYPKGWKIEKKQLIQLWMAQGYLEGLDDERQMEDVGYEFLSTLQRSSFFQSDEKFGDENQDSFRMHDLMFDLALMVAGNNYSLGSERANTPIPSKEKNNTPIHICISEESSSTNLLGSLDARKVRTIFLQLANDRETTQMTGELSVILRFKSLRVFNLSHSSIMTLPNLIGKLKHLRYLDLSWCVNLVSLPQSIGNLVNLQTLKLTGCEKLQFSTKIVTKLISLRHLEIHRCKAFEDMMPAGLGKLSSLQSLSNFYVVDDKKKKAGKLNELQNLNSLRGNLEINRLGQVSNVMLDSQNVNLKDKNLLESLDLNWENRSDIKESFQLLENLCPHQLLKRLHVQWYPGDKFSNWLSSINHLSHISLFGFDNCISLPPLENLPYLKSVEISSMKVLEYIYLEEAFHSAAIFFPSLEQLKFSGCENFKGWKRMEGQASVDNLSLPPFCRLSQLIINNCPKLTDLPTFPIVEELQLCESMLKPLKETLDIASSSSSTPLSMIKSLKIEGKLPDISVLPSQWKQNLTHLEHLEIGDVDNLDIWFEDNFPSLKKVVVYGCNLEALPSKMCDMLSLQHIKMMGCHKLASLPKEMVKLAKLATIEIWDCPLLVERCQKETGADWPQIKHVKKIIFK